MTRKSRREIERAVEDLDDSDDGDESGIAIVYEDDGEYFDEDGEPVPTDDGSPTPAGAGLVVILSREYAAGGCDGRRADQ